MHAVTTLVDLRLHFVKLCHFENGKNGKNVKMANLTPKFSQGFSSIITWTFLVLKACARICHFRQLFRFRKILRLHRTLLANLFPSSRRNQVKTLGAISANSFHFRQIRRFRRIRQFIGHILPIHFQSFNFDKNVGESWSKLTKFC